jgi:hypothetical protein
MRAHTTSSRIRRHDAAPVATEPVLFTRIVAEAPPPPAKPPRPVGDLSAAPAGEIVSVVGEVFASRNRNALADYRHGMRRLLEILEQYRGSTWQERWEAAGLNEPGHPVAGFGDSPKWRSRLHIAAGNAWCMRLIQPSVPVLRAAACARYAERFRQVARDPLLEEFCTRLDAHPVSADTRSGARTELCYALTVFGIDMSGITPGALVLHAEQAPGRGMAAAWPVLHSMGLLPAWVPRTLQDARIRGRLSVEDLVDRHHLRNQEIRDLLVDYIRRRSAEVDYATMENLVRSLVEYFWKIIENVRPGQADLRLTEQAVQAWKERLLVRKDGKPRLNIEAPFLAVRAFYLDLQTWSAAEPERWARWVAPCPIRDADLRWFNIRKRRLRERMAARTRDRQPLLAILSQHVNDRWQNMRAPASRSPPRSSCHRCQARLAIRSVACRHTSLTKPGSASITASRFGRLVSTWNVCRRASAITAQVRATKLRLIRACPTSLMLFTKTLRGVRHRNGSSSTSACMVTPNPGPLVRGSPSR